MKLIIDAISDKGKVRNSNEDMILVGNDCLRDASKSYEFDFTTYEFPFMIAVADGLGGHKGGAHASEIVQKKMASTVNQLPLNLKQSVIKSYFIASVQSIHQCILDEGNINFEVRGMASTFSGVLFYGAKIFLTHIGDSRIYHFSKGKLTRFSRDHSLQELKGNNGALRTAIVNAFGAPDLFLDFEEITAKLQNEDILLICTDGLSKELSDEEIANCLSKPNCHSKLVDEAQKAGGNDNISIAVIRYIKNWQ